MTIAINIKKIREKHSLTQEELVKIANVSSMAAVMQNDGNEAVMRRMRGANTLILPPESTNPKHMDRVITADSDHVVKFIGAVVWFQVNKEMD